MDDALLNLATRRIPPDENDPTIRCTKYMLDPFRHARETSSARNR
jgi:hypothetical protein